MARLQQVTAREGDMLDQLVWRHRGRTAGLVEQTLELNPGLSVHGPILPAGTIVTLPAASEALPTRETVKLWG